MTGTDTRAPIVRFLKPYIARAGGRPVFEAVVNATEAWRWRRWRRWARSVVFVCGCPHSGTTLFANILAAHQDTYTPTYETRAFLDPPPWLTLRQLRVELIRAGKQVLVEKTPKHLVSVDWIRRVVPGARFIVAVRDGRDVTASLAARHGGEFRAQMQLWTERAQAVEALRGSPDVHILRYEDLVADPPREIRGMCVFASLDPEDSRVFNHHEKPRLWYGQTTIVPAGATDNEARRNWQVNQPIFDGSGRWKKDLPPDLLPEFAEGETGRLMRLFGYATAAP